MSEHLTAEQLAELDRQNAKTDEFLRRRSVQREQQEAPIIHKTYDPIEQRSQQTELARLVDERIAQHLSAVNADLATLDKALDAIHGDQGQLITDAESEFQATIEYLEAHGDAIEKLRSEIAALRADLNIVTAITRGEVATLKAKAADVA